MGNVTDNDDARSELEDDIKKLEDVAVSVERPTVPDTKLQELEYTAPGDDQLRAAATDALASYKASGIAAIKSDSAENEKALRAKRDDYRSALSGELDALSGAYADAARSIDGDVLKRGLARSSVAVNRKSELESDHAARAADIRAAYGKQIADLDAQISGVGAKLNAALNDFNLAYAAKLNDSLNTLKAERDKKAQEVLKYNNEIKAKQAALDINKLKAESDLYTAALNQRKKATDLASLTPDERDAIYKSIYDKMEAFLGSMTKEQARLEIRNHALYRNHLSDFYYYKLYDKYGR